MKDKSMKKSIAILSLGLILGTSVITGCSLITTNYDRYYNAVAAKIDFKDGSKIEITRKDLRTAYSTYNFSQYVDNGSTQEEAYSKTLDYLVSKELAIRDAEVRSREINTDDSILTIQEKEYLWEKTYEAMESNIDSYKKETEAKDDTKNEKSITRTVYERKAELIYNEELEEYSLILPESAKSDIETHIFWSSGNKDVETKEGKEEIYQLMLNYIKDNSENKDNYQKYLSDIRTSEKNLNLSTEAKLVFEREIDRVYGIIYDSYMVNKYQDFIGGQKTNNVIISDMLDLYSSKVRSDYSNYNGGDQTDAVKEKSGGIYYFEDGINWFYVSHILVKFDTQEQADYDMYTAEIEKIKKGEESQYSLEQAQKAIEDLYNNLVGIERVETSENVWEEKDGVVAPNVDILYKKIQDSINKEKTSKDKIEKFDDLIYQYNEDTGIINATYNYIVGVDYTKPIADDDGKVKTYTSYSNWVSSFNDAAIALYNNGEGQVGDLYDSGEYNGLIRSNYGIHIMMYAGEAGNLFDGIDQNFELENKDIIKLYNTRLNAGTEKTYFDLMYEECVPQTSSIFQSLDLDRLKGSTSDITYYPQAF